MTKSQLKKFIVAYQISMMENDQRSVEQYEKLLAMVYRLLDGKSLIDEFRDEFEKKTSI